MSAVDPVQEQPTTTAEAVPVIRVVRGHPSPVQLAALTAVLTAGSGPADDTGSGSGARTPGTLWTARSRFARPRPAVGPGGWRASALPR
ncbi:MULTISPECIES: acyl-CoA carboxylase subunit epsilon [unclassified Serinicoccus]|uniref:acyl-CoA carboxylase subunit epsilon n=1 Tax=unclassified Serinicoccus TaxID=2643101 RepID=UPI003853BC41